MAPHSGTLAWKFPWTEEPSGLQSMGRGRGRAGAECGGHGVPGGAELGTSSPRLRLRAGSAQRPPQAWPHVPRQEGGSLP